jgi:hypothetical protein
MDFNAAAETSCGISISDVRIRLTKSEDQRRVLSLVLSYAFLSPGLPPANLF